MWFKGLLKSFSVDVAKKIQGYAKSVFILSVITSFVIPVVTVFTVCNEGGYSPLGDFMTIWPEVFFPTLFGGLIAGAICAFAGYIFAFIIHMLGGFYENIEKSAKYQEATYKLLESNKTDAPKVH